MNRGTVGYQHMGYNVGGIAGSQTGYIEGCVNYGTVTPARRAAASSAKWSRAARWNTQRTRCRSFPTR